MTIDKNTMESVNKRRQVGELCKSNFKDALSIAKSIPDPWHKAQSLAEVAMHAPAKYQKKIIEDSFKSASELQDPNRIATVSAYPLKCACELGFPDEFITSKTNSILSTLKKLDHHVRIVDALSDVVGAIQTGPRNNYIKTVKYLVEVCKHGYSWRIDHSLRFLVPAVYIHDKDLAQKLVETIKSDKIRRRVIRQLEKLETSSPTE
ncbi:MAG: hypothetical protein ACPGXY_03790 [Alphaproteobacteria bacterium]